MFKNLNAWLITRYPLLWNTRVVFVLPIVLLIHGLFYLAGYSQLIDFSSLKLYKLFDGEEVVLFSCLLTAVLLLIWLVYYLRNNPFKAIYPISKTYMFGEFLMLFIVLFSSATFFLTYRQGLYDQTKRLTEETDLVEEANMINLAYHFIPTSVEFYRAHRSCDSIKAREQRREARMLIYQEAQSKGIRLEKNFIDFEPTSYSDSLPPSYLNYCALRIDDLDTGIIVDSEENSKRVVNWLKSGQKDSVIYVLSRFKELLIKYDVDHNFNPNMQADSVFAYSDFYVADAYFATETDNEYNYDKELLDYQEAPVLYIDSYDLTGSIERIETIRRGFWDYEVLLVLLYYAMSATILLFSFRMMKIRIWFAALIGVGLWSILLGLFVSLSDLEEEGLGYLVLLLYLAFFVIMISLIRNKGSKFISGLAYLWSIWLQLAVLPIILAIVMKSYYDRYREYDKYREYESELGNWITPAKPPEYIWLQENLSHLFSLNLAVFLVLLILIYIPLARKWQANPEE